MRVRQSTITIGAGLAFAAMAIALIVGVLNVQSSSHELQKATEREHAFDRASTEVTTASDFLTNEVRSYAVSTDRAHLDAYWTEIDKTKGRDEAVADLKRNGAQKDELALIDEANANSDALVATETRAMWLVLRAAGTPASAMPPAVGEYRPSAADRALSSDAKLATARRILFDDKYLSAKASIGAPIEEFKRHIAARARGDVKAAEGARDSTITILLILSVLVALAMAGVLAVFHRGVGTVVSRYSAALRDRDQDDREFALDPAGTVELRELAGAFNSQFAANAAQLDENDRLVADLKNLVGEVTDASTTVNSAAQQMSATSAEAGRAVGEIANAVGDVAQGAERQVRQLESVRNSAADAATAARTSAEQARGATEAAEEARRHARDGVGAAERATEAMQSVRDSSQSVTEAIRELASRSDRIGAIVDTITGIAGQTNLLALNAAIEAARAGEQGRGFAVVAEEVRKLAEESQRAAEEISGLIAQIQSETQTAVGVVQDGAQRTEDGAATVDETRAAFERIGTAVEDVNARIAEIATATDQISSGTAKIQEEIAEVASVAQESSASTEQVSASTEQTSASTQEIAATAGELAATAGELERLVGQLRI